MRDPIIESSELFLFFPMSLPSLLYLHSVMRSQIQGHAGHARLHK